MGTSQYLQLIRFVSVTQRTKRNEIFIFIKNDWLINEWNKNEWLTTSNISIHVHKQQNKNNQNSNQWRCSYLNDVCKIFFLWLLWRFNVLLPTSWDSDRTTSGESLGKQQGVQPSTSIIDPREPRLLRLILAFKPRVTKCSLKSDSSFYGKSKWLLLCWQPVVLVLQCWWRHHIMRPHTHTHTAWRVRDGSTIWGYWLWAAINKPLWACWDETWLSHTKTLAAIHPQVLLHPTAVWISLWKHMD